MVYAPGGANGLKKKSPPPPAVLARHPSKGGTTLPVVQDLNHLICIIYLAICVLTSESSDFKKLGNME